MHLQVTMDHIHGMTVVDDADEGAHDLRSRALRKVPLVCDSVEELAASAALHDQMDVALVFKRAVNLHHVLVACQVKQNLNFSPHVLDVLRRDELAL
eukprot:304094-Chlamydomonas_euryale.AAC.3